MNSQWVAVVAVLLIVIGAVALFKRQLLYPLQWFFFKLFERKVKRLGRESRLPNDHIDNAVRRSDARSLLAALAIDERVRPTDPFSGRRKSLLQSEWRGAMEAGLKYGDLKESELDGWESLMD